jgi:hypothetical protein
MLEISALRWRLKWIVLKNKQLFCNVVNVVLNMKSIIVDKVEIKFPRKVIKFSNLPAKIGGLWEELEALILGDFGSIG